MRSKGEGEEGALFDELNRRHSGPSPLRNANRTLIFVTRCADDYQARQLITPMKIYCGLEWLEYEHGRFTP